MDAKTLQYRQIRKDLGALIENALACGTFLEKTRSELKNAAPLIALVLGFYFFQHVCCCPLDVSAICLASPACKTIRSTHLSAKKWYPIRREFAAQNATAINNRSKEHVLFLLAHMPQLHCQDLWPVAMCQL